MANPPPGGPPGNAGGSSAYPQYGVKGKNIRSAGSAAAKEKDISAGYLAWFSSRAAAQEFIGSQSGPLSGNIGVPDPLSGIDAVGHFFSDLTHGDFWRSLGWIALGIALILLGLAIWLRKPIEAAAGPVAMAAMAE
jgi:hypothetical protein